MMEKQINDLVIDALNSRDETRIKSLVIRALELFLEGKIKGGHLDELGHAFLYMKFFKDYQMKDKNLEDCFEILAAVVEFLPKNKAKRMATLLIESLKENKDSKHEIEVLAESIKKTRK